MPSAPQKRDWANGRSADTLSTVTSSREPALSLKWRTLAWHTPVSMLGKMLMTSALPAKSPSVTSSSFPPARVKAGAGEPTAGRSPTVWIALPRSVISAMGGSLHGGPAGQSPAWWLRARAASEVAQVDHHDEGDRDAQQPPLVAGDEGQDV